MSSRTFLEIRWCYLLSRQKVASSLAQPHCSSDWRGRPGTKTAAEEAERRDMDTQHIRNPVQGGQRMGKGSSMEESTVEEEGTPRSWRRVPLAPWRKRES